MDVSGMGSVQGSSPVRSTAPATPATPARPAETSGISAPKDELQISEAGQMLGRLSETPEARAERIAQIKEQIDAGEFDTDEKLEAALSRMFQVHGFDLGDE
jgi:anti-sigma28 factor (negative regulator of flagellin synthesis)